MPRCLKNGMVIASLIHQNGAERVVKAGQLDVRIIYGYVTIMLVDQECLEYEVTT